jgi:hypothetical protein
MLNSAVNPLSLMNDSIQLRRDLARVIGADINDITAKDPTRHFDPITFASTFATLLFFEFAKAAGSAIKKRLEEAAAAQGKQVGEAVWQAITKLVGLKTPSKDSQPQDAQFKDADQSLKEVVSGLDSNEVNYFFVQGEGALRAKLEAEGLLPERAGKKAHLCAEAIRKHAVATNPPSS